MSKRKGAQCKGCGNFAACGLPCPWCWERAGRLDEAWDSYRSSSAPWPSGAPVPSQADPDPSEQRP